MLNFLTKLTFFFKTPAIIIVAGSGRQSAAEAVFSVLKQRYRVKKLDEFSSPLDLKSVIANEILIIESEVRNLRPFEVLIKRSVLPILVLTHFGEIPVDKDFFAADIEQVKEVAKLAELLPAHGRLILNFDDETVREIKKKSRAHPLTFGFQDGADIRASDCHITKTIEIGTNFKINYQGKIIPIWLNRLFGKSEIYAALASSCVGMAQGLNLVEVSQALKLYQGISGRMQLIRGVKGSFVLDDSESASVFSMTEALEILKMIEGQGRRIAVLGDVVGIGKYAIEAHEAIGERAGNACDLLFTVGPRAKFIAQGAKSRGIAENKIFQFDEVQSAAKALQNEIREGDLILVDGSKEMKMGKIVEEVKAA